MNFKHQASETFWKKFYRLSSRQKESVRSAWAIFNVNPFDPRINSLSVHYKKTIYSVVIEADLRVVFYLEGETVWTVDIGTHSIYM